MVTLEQLLDATKPTADRRQAMRLIPRHRHQQRQRKARISITQEEINADLHYPAGARDQERATGYRRIEVR
jgi:hypothetical protein